MTVIFLGPSLQAFQKFSKTGQQRVREVFEDAASELQFEMLERSMLAEHSAEELVAFADAIRALADPGVYEACTLHSALPTDFTVDELLRAESDPLFAFELRGNHIDPPESFERAVGAPPQPAIASRRSFDVAPTNAPRPQKAKAVPSLSMATDHLVKPRAKPSFEFDESSLESEALDWSSISERQRLPPAPPPSAPSTNNVKIIEDLLNESTRVLGVTFKESDVDLPGGMTLNEAVHSAFGVVSRGIPVPVAIGPKPGVHKRLAIILQVSVTQKTRAFQLYEPVSNEVLWMNESDLLAGRELVFRNKTNRRITRMILPQSARNPYSY
jgi:hypothetical protein